MFSPVLFVPASIRGESLAPRPPVVRVDLYAALPVHLAAATASALPSNVDRRSSFIPGPLRFRWLRCFVAGVGPMGFFRCKSSVRSTCSILDFPHHRKYSNERSEGGEIRWQNRSKKRAPAQRSISRRQRHRERQ